MRGLCPLGSYLATSQASGISAISLLRAHTSRQRHQRYWVPSPRGPPRNRAPLVSLVGTVGGCLLTSVEATATCTGRVRQTNAFSNAHSSSPYASGSSVRPLRLCPVLPLGCSAGYLRRGCTATNCRYHADVWTPWCFALLGGSSDRLVQDNGQPKGRFAISRASSARANPSADQKSGRRIHAFATPPRYY